MARLLFLICLIAAIVALVGAAMAACSRAARNSRALAKDLTPATRGQPEGDGMRRIGYAALLLLMLGVTSGLVGGL